MQVNGRPRGWEIIEVMKRKPRKAKRRRAAAPQPPAEARELAGRERESVEGPVEHEDQPDRWISERKAGDVERDESATK